MSLQKSNLHGSQSISEWEVSEYKDDRTDILNFYYHNAVITQGHFNLQHDCSLSPLNFNSNLDE